MKFLLASSLVFSFFLFVVSGVIGTNEACRLRAMIRSHQFMLLEDEPRVESAMKYTYDSVYVGSQKGLMEADRIKALPDQPKGVDFDQYGGYVTVDPKNGRALFYYFVEAPQESSSKPLVLWLNGGPGCSSLGNGAMMELGPFIVDNEGKTLYKNNYAWNNVANMLFLESPAGTGFSYSNTTTDYDELSDERTTKDNYTFLINWLERFSQYKGRDLFIAGESYAGHFIPDLANAIIANNKKNATIINLKGIAIGNGYLDFDINEKGTFEFLWTHALISNVAHDAILANCTFVGQGNYTVGCFDAMGLAYDEIGHNIDSYNIYAPFCAGPMNFPRSNDGIKVSDPCTWGDVDSYFNRADVQRALHANTTGLPYLWTGCSNLVNFKARPRSMLLAIKQVIESNISVWLYSGDVDSVVPVTATQYNLEDLHLPVEVAWHPWYTSNAQVGGYVIGYKGLVFATVRGAGHMVPMDQPERAFTLFSSFIQGKLCKLNVLIIA